MFLYIGIHNSREISKNTSNVNTVSNASSITTTSSNHVKKKATSTSTAGSSSPSYKEDLLPVADINNALSQVSLSRYVFVNLSLMLTSLYRYCEDLHLVPLLL